MGGIEPLDNGLLLLGLITLALKVFAFVDGAVRPTTAYPAAGKKTKPFWLIILGVAVVWNAFQQFPVDIINVAGLIAAIIYVVDVRPAVRALGKGGGRAQGPYGPY